MAEDTSDLAASNNIDDALGRARHVVVTDPSGVSQIVPRGTWFEVNEEGGQLLVRDAGRNLVAAYNYDAWVQAVIE